MIGKNGFMKPLSGKNNVLANLADIHEKVHDGQDRMLMRCGFFVFSTKRMARRIFKHYFTCKYLAKLCREQR